jgi:hypothetical protein
VITIHKDDRSADIVASSLPFWEGRGWSTEASVAPKTLRRAVARAQPSDVTAPGESEVEGALPTQDEE